MYVKRWGKKGGGIKESCGQGRLGLNRKGELDFQRRQLLSLNLEEVKCSKWRDQPVPPEMGAGLV